MGGVSAGWRARQLHTFQAVYTSEIKGPVVTLALRTNPVVKVSRKGSGFHFSINSNTSSARREKYTSAFVPESSLSINCDCLPGVVS